jgi:glycosyltransferase involved in cell wall biosynthesis
VRVGYDVTPALVDQAGVGRYTTELLRALRATDGLEVERLAASGRRVTGRNRLFEGLRREGLYYPLGLSRKARGLDVVHVPAVYAARVSGRPLVVTFHDVLALRFPELFTRRVAAYIRAASQRTASRAARITVPSEYTRSEMVELLDVDPARIVVTSEGAHERFRPTPRDERWLRERFGIEGRYVLSVGTLEPRKNLIAALRAFDRLDAGCTLVLAGGSGWRNEALHAEIARTRGTVVVTGFVSDDELVRLYGAAACFVYPSLYEGFGLPPLEAMACGAPVVTSDTASLPEVVGDAGLLVDPHDVDALAAAIASVLEDPARAADLRERGLERSRRFSWERTAQATADVYRDAVAAFA